MPPDSNSHRIADRFRGFLPVVVDVETGGFNPQTDALLEISAQVIDMQRSGELAPGAMVSVNVEPFPNANLEPKSLEITGIDPGHPFRNAVPEKEALQSVFQLVRKVLKDSGCTRAVLVGHNPAFDLGFINAAVSRNSIKRNPFHKFTTFDTATLGGLAFGQTVLAKAVQHAGMTWDNGEAHSAVYDTQRTAELFCRIANTWHRAVGIPPPDRS